jgi:hypothetical protein
MFAMHNAFRTRLAQSAALSGRGLFKTAQALASQVGDPRNPQCLFRESGGALAFTLIVRVLTSSGQITFWSAGEEFGPYLPDDLVLVASPQMLSSKQ